MWSSRSTSVLPGTSCRSAASAGRAAIDAVLSAESLDEVVASTVVGSTGAGSGVLPAGGF